jgi:hypothetical protein
MIPVVPRILAAFGFFSAHGHSASPIGLLRCTSGASLAMQSVWFAAFCAAQARNRGSRNFPALDGEVPQLLRAGMALLTCGLIQLAQQEAGSSKSLV